MSAWFLSLDLIYQLIFVFCLGMAFDFVILIFVLHAKNKKINAYQRQLEKESINTDENSARVKVLEQKIEVLEKALENALKNK